MDVYSDESEDENEDGNHQLDVEIGYRGGDKYIGTVLYGKPHDKGKFIEKSTGNTYDGYWVRGYRHGYGIQTWN